MESQLELAEKAGSLAREILEIEGLLKRNHDVILQLQRKAALFRDQKFDAERRFAETMDRLMSLSSRDLAVDAPPAFVPPGMKKSAEAQEDRLTGNSLNRVFEPDQATEDSPSSDGLVHAAMEQTWNDLRGAFVGAHRDAMNFGEGAVCISNAGDEITATRIPPTAESEACVDGFEQCAKNVRSQQSVGPVAGAVDPFRYVTAAEFPDYDTSTIGLINKTLSQRRREFDRWFLAQLNRFNEHDKKHMFRPLSEDEASSVWDCIIRHRACGIDNHQAVRSAFDSMLLARKGS